MYNFYFDESAHDRAITYKYEKGLNIYMNAQNDLFLGFFLGVKKEKELDYLHQYLTMEKYWKDKLYGLNEHQEFKGTTIAKRKFEFGFKSFHQNDLKVYSNLFQLLDNEEIIFNVHMYSKTEYLILEYFEELNLPTCIPMEEYNAVAHLNQKELIYSLIKFLFNYRNQELLAGLFSGGEMSSEVFLEKLKSMLDMVINQTDNVERKGRETPVLKFLLRALGHADIKGNPQKKYEWDYSPLFIGLSEVLKDLRIEKHSVKLIIDPEGTGNILGTAKQQGFLFSFDNEDSKGNGLIRISDILSNMFQRLSLSIYEAIKEDPFVNAETHDYATKHMLSKEWFDIKQEDVYQLYVRLNKILRVNNPNYCKVRSGIYLDYSEFTLALIAYIGGKFMNFEDYKRQAPEIHAKCFNDYVMKWLDKEQKRKLK
ncbi:hypothetical protein RGU39_21075 [Bacillus wiedmannii]|uniref:hypothetical protein n=1 Tax=Bacillus wiedmannii TaxID=1890302 RepID=UPI0028531CDE|nr:hypothetical protein [Bacillus wiedmannii]MDR4943056.1 hypothetical protein [Bacillus wiedmannii]